jgi:exopolysaccharide production protein ExoY
MLDVVSRSLRRDLLIGYGPKNTLKISSGAYVRFKRCFDIIATLALAPMALVIVGILAILVRRDGGNAFFCQTRVGRNGEVFKLWKLRTMVPDADEVLRAYLERDAGARAEWEKTQKLRTDLRITPMGRYLRKYSADELPQLWNVFVGQMSLVGPRPMCPEQQSQYPGVAYFQVRPGMTGLWQVSARNSCSFAERAIYDNEYAGAMSFAKDIQILLSTPYAVLRGTGL